jgi:hypothetical protein
MSSDYLQFHRGRSFWLAESKRTLSICGVTVTTPSVSVAVPSVIVAISRVHRCAIKGRMELIVSSHHRLLSVALPKNLAV